MMFLPKKTMVLFDLEYADPKECEANGWPIEIFEIGACKVDHLMNEIEWFHSFIRPSRLEFLTPSCTILTGIKKGNLEFAPEFDVVGKQFRDFCGYCPMMSWSINDFVRLHYSYGEWPFVYPFFDALSFTAGLIADSDYIIKSYSLQSMCESFGVSKPNHSAIGDVKCMIELLRRIMNPDSPDLEMC